MKANYLRTQVVAEYLGGDFVPDSQITTVSNMIIASDSVYRYEIQHGKFTEAQLEAIANARAKYRVDKGMV